jgi:hypothetical protein
MAYKIKDEVIDLLGDYAVNQKLKTFKGRKEF